MRLQGKFVSDYLHRSLCILFGILFTTGCTTLAQEYASKAALLKMKRSVIAGKGFQHVIYSKTGAVSKVLHIYLDGDGTVWIAGRPSDDPTPRNPLVLNLMALDKAPAAYVGRPCYHGMHAAEMCSSRFWLNDRYAEEVVASLFAVIKQLLQQGDYQKVALFGHSGGGTLAVLLAARLSETVSVVTVAANLDLDAWSTYTENNDLKGSLNPAKRPTLSPLIRQRHFAGGNDEIVPPALMAKAVEHLGSQLIVIDDFDHVCCWERLWNSILDEIAK